MQCTLCMQRIAESEIDSHYLQELRLFESKSFEPTRKKRLKTSTATSLGALEKKLVKLKGNRAKRSKIKKEAIIETTKDTSQEPACPICNLILPNDPESVNLHVDMCLQNKDWTEYSWAGVTRVRATALVDAPLQSLGFTAVCKDQETEEEIDIDNETDEFGPSQFSESDLVNPASTSSTTINSSAPVADLLVESLKERIRDLEKRKAKDCLICLDSFKDPVVSTVCWHVHCEKCWLATLSAKKLCPQCSKITSPSDLRRIFM